MPAQVLTSVENNFTKGLITEFTGLNFPENASTDTDNSTYTIVGDVTRREGIDFEDNAVLTALVTTNKAISSYKWNNAGGDGLTQVFVVQVGTSLKFYSITSATVASPLSAHLLASSVDMTTLGTIDGTLECQFTDGNGYLFVTHPSCDPFYCTYASGTITATSITIQIRDFSGILESVSVGTRPSTLSSEHQYNLVNQGWNKGNPWTATTNTSPVVVLGSKVYAIQSGLTIPNGTRVTMYVDTQSTGNINYVFGGTVTGYTGGNLTINVDTLNSQYAGFSYTSGVIIPINTGYLDTWFAAVGNYPSNADIWWYYKNTSGVFDPATTYGNVSFTTGNAPSGHFILNAFSQSRSVVASIPSLTDVTTTVRPRTTAWFQGRTWFSGVDAQQPATGDAAYYTWTENIYFSQISTDPSSFGQCYQVNDPTSETLFDLLPDDGGVITIQGSGSIYKLYPIQNGMLVFAANGIWFITGSKGIGFSANDYTITKISSVRSLSATSFVDVNGLPYFWNEEGIYAVQPGQNGGLTVEPLTVGTILSFYNEIPASSKRYARGTYHPIDYVIQWIYNSEEAVDVTDRYTYDKILNFNTYNKAFYPYTINTTTAAILSIVYIEGPGGSTAPPPMIKYFTASGSNVTFSDEHDTDYVDWASAVVGGVSYDSYFITGYKLHGQGQKRFQLPYLYVFSRAEVPTAYKIQSIWDYATSGNSGKYSSEQRIYNNKPYFGMIFRRHRLRGQGIVLQIKITSVAGQPYDIMGWSTFETMNAGI